MLRQLMSIQEMRYLLQKQEEEGKDGDMDAAAAL